MAQSAAAGRRRAVSSGDDGSRPPPLGPRPFATHRPSRAGWGPSPSPASDTLARRRSASNLLETGSGRCAGELDDALLRAGEAARTLRARDDVAALVDFLRNHPPPPGNFMSSPDGADGEEEEAEEEEEEARGRWSRIRKMGRRSKSAPRAPRTIRLPDSAVSGVTIGGHRHIAISIPLVASPSGEDMRSQYPVYPRQDLSMGTPSKEPVRICTNDKGVVTVLRPVTEACESSSPQPRSPRPGGEWPSPRARTSKPHDYIGILPTRFDTPLLDDGSAPWSRAPSPGEGPARGGPSPGAFRRSAYPARGSSMAAGRHMHHPASIDGLISQQQEPWRGATCGPRHGSAPSPPADAAAVPSKPAPTATGGRPAPVTGQDGNGPKLTVISDSPIVSRRADSPPPPPPPASPKSRRDIVRDKKRRDMEAVRSATQQKTRADAGDTGEPKPADGPDDDARGRAQRNGDNEPAPTLAMSGMMVVVDLEPCPSLEERPRRPAQHPSTPTPPVAASAAPPQSHGATDRTSLARRREWRATREQGRRARDAAAPPPPSDLYEAYREHRLQDVERRLRRLERNRDVWTKALVPVLDGLKRAHAHGEEEPPPEEPLPPGPRRDASGLGAIEPLMRELAGEARRRRSMRTARTLAICDEGARRVG